MTYVIALPCVDLKDKACIEECPVDCIYEGDRMLYIHPDECVDCGACEPVCPTEAIFYERPDVLTISLHQDRCFPTDSGFAKDRGRGRGEHESHRAGDKRKAQADELHVDARPDGSVEVHGHRCAKCDADQRLNVFAVLAPGQYRSQGAQARR